MNKALIRDVMHAERLRAEMHELAPKVLAVKFNIAQEGETPEQGADRVRKISYGQNHHPDSELIWQCLEERKRLRDELTAYSDRALSRHYRIKETQCAKIPEWLSSGKINQETLEVAA